MSREILIARQPDGAEARFLLEVFEDQEHWTSVLSRLNAAGEPEPSDLAPRFYGLTHEQARRRMVSVLENQYEDVAAAPPV